MKYEFLIEANLSEDELNGFGDEGWSLVAVTRASYTNERKGYEEVIRTFYFQREKEMRYTARYRDRDTRVGFTLSITAMNDRSAQERAQAHVKRNVWLEITSLRNHTMRRDVPLTGDTQ